MNPLMGGSGVSHITATIITLLIISDMILIFSRLWFSLYTLIMDLIITLLNQCIWFCIQYVCEVYKISTNFDVDVSDMMVKIIYHDFNEQSFIMSSGLVYYAKNINNYIVRTPWRLYMYVIIFMRLLERLVQQITKDKLRGIHMVFRIMRQNWEEAVLAKNTGCLVDFFDNIL